MKDSWINRKKVLEIWFIMFGIFSIVLSLFAIKITDEGFFLKYNYSNLFFSLYRLKYGLIGITIILSLSSWFSSLYFYPNLLGKRIKKKDDPNMKAKTMYFSKQLLGVVFIILVLITSIVLLNNYLNQDLPSFYERWGKARAK